MSIWAATATNTSSATSTATSISHLHPLPSPDPRQIKKRIEDLIAREYLERDASNSTVYKYLA